MESGVSFATVLKCSNMVNVILQEDRFDKKKRKHSEYKQLLEILMNIISPILVESFKSFYKNSITDSFIKLMFSCFMRYHESDSIKLINHFKSTIPSLQEIYIEFESEKDKKQKKSKSNLLTKYFKPNKYNNLFNDIPNDLLSHSMSYIDAVDLTELEIISHKFLQCARAPIAINILTQNFFDAIYCCFEMQEHPQCLIRNAMKKYIHLKNVHINKNVLEYVMDTYDDEEFNLDEKLSWIHFDESTVKALYEISYDDYDHYTENGILIEIDTLNMNIIRGLKYMPLSYKSLSINLPHHYQSVDDEYFLWNNIEKIRLQFQRFNDIELLLNLAEYNSLSRFLWFCACCHPNIECLRIKHYCFYPFCGDVTCFFMKNYQNIIPELHELKWLSINSYFEHGDDKQYSQFVEDGKCFMNALMNKIKKHKLEILEIEQWYYSWIDIDRLKIWILNHYKSLHTLKFHINNDDAEYDDIFFDIGDIEIWKPIILIHELMVNYNESKEIDYWFNNVLKTFEFVIILMDTDQFGDSLMEYIDQFQSMKHKLNVSVNINLKIYHCIKYFMKKNIKWTIRIDARMQQRDDDICDPLPIYHDFFWNATMNTNDYNYMLEFLPQKQTLVTDYFG